MRRRFGTDPWGHLAEAALYLNVAWLLVHDYVYRLEGFVGPLKAFYDAPGGIQDLVATGHGIDPYRTRILVPAAVQALGDVKIDGFAIFGSSATRYYAYFLACLFALMVLVRIMLGAFGLARGLAIGGALMVGAVLPIALRDHGFQPWSWLEVCLLALSVTLALRRAPRGLFALVCLVAVFNRETALFLPLVFLALAAANRHQRPIRDWYLRGAAAGWLVTVPAFLLLHFVWPGPADRREITLGQIWDQNQSAGSHQRAATNIALLLAGIAVCSAVAIAKRRAPRDAVYIAAFTVPPFVAIWAVFAIWWEARVLVPVLVLLVPIGFAALAGDRDPPPEGGLRRGRRTGAPARASCPRR